MSFRPTLLILLVCALGLAFIPFRSLDCPFWDVWVVDEFGRPVPGITLRLSYRDYSAEAETHEVSITADRNGHAGFLSRTLSASLMRRLVFTLLSARTGVHASFGPHASVVAFGEGFEGVAVDPKKNVVEDWTGEPRSMESRIVVAREEF